MTLIVRPRLGEGSAINGVVEQVNWAAGATCGERDRSSLERGGEVGMRAMRRFGMLAMTFAPLMMVTVTVPAHAEDAGKRVHCEKGQSLAKALEHARPGDTLLLSGICQERVTI